MPPAQPRLRQFPLGRYATAALSGMGAVLVAALLPALAQRASGRPSSRTVAGFAVSRLGSFAGGITTLMPPGRSLRLGPVYSAAAMLCASSALAIDAPPWVLDALLLLFGYGLGQLEESFRFLISSFSAILADDPAHARETLHKFCDVAVMD